jgi:hypothetical protein
VESGFVSGAKLESLFARFMPMILEEQTKGDMVGIVRSDADDGLRALALETDGLLKSLESAEVGGWTLPDPSDTRAGSHAIVKVDDGNLSVIQAGQHRSWILKARELAALTAKAEQSSKAPTVATILDALQSGINHAPDAHWRAEPCGPIVSTAVGMMLRVPGLEQQNRELHQALAKRKAAAGRPPTPVSDTGSCASKTVGGDVVGEALRGAARLVHRIINDVPPPRWPFDLVPLRDLISRAEHVRGPLPACCARAETAERHLAELRCGVEALRARLQAAK